MKYHYYLCCLLLMIATVSTTAVAQDEMRVTVQTDTFSNNISGPGAGSSNLTDSASYSHVFSLHSASNTEKSQFSFDMGARYTDDPRIDPSLYSFTGLRMRMSGSGRTLNVGDTFESFSQYTLSSAVKGLSYKMNQGSTTAPEVTFLYGYAYPRWDGFRSSEETKSIKRLVYGTRAQKSFSQFFSAGLNLVRSNDSDRVYAADTLYDIDSYALDWEYKPFSDLSIRGESCFADTTLSPGGGTASKANGSAHRIVFDGNTRPIKLTAEYEKVTPGFYSTMGSATRDREKVKLRWRQRLSTTKTVNYGFLWFKDNLSDTKAYTSQHFRPEVGYTFRNVFNRRYASADVNLMLDRRYGGGNSVNNRYLSLGYRDRLGAYDADFNIGYTDYDSKLQLHNREYVYNVNLGSRSTRGNTIIRPRINLGGSTLNDELNNLTDQIWNYSVGMVVEVPSRDFRTSFNVGQNKLNRDQGNDSAKWYGTLDVRYRPKWLADYNAESIFLKVFINDYNYSVDANDFRESGVIGGLNMLY